MTAAWRSMPGGSAVRCCSRGCGKSSASARCWMACWRRASSALPSSAPCLWRPCTGCSSRAPTGTACRGWPTMTSAARRLSVCIIFTARWRGSARPSRASGPSSTPRCVKDVIEERLFERRRDLFTDLSVVFMDTTSLSFEGDGGESLGQHGYSKDLRPDLQQMILGLVMDGAGWPVCTEMWPGNTADVTVLLPIVDRLRQRFGIGRVCVVADRGMISAETIAGLEARGLDYILGAREHTDKLVRQIVLDDTASFVPLAIERRQGETQLFVKEVKRAGVRYIVCRNDSEA